jgi:hypothetical protein
MFRRTLAEMTGHELKVVRRDAEHGRKLSGRRKGATSTLTRKITDYLDRHPRATPHGLLAASEKISKP